LYNADQQRQLFEESKNLLADAKRTLDAASRKETANKLRSVIQFHEWAYYVQNNPLISDYEYDQLYKQLESLETNFPELVTPDSPTKRVSPDLTYHLTEVGHLTPMLSLENSYDAQDLLEFDAQIKKRCGLNPNEPICYCIEPKYDGGTIALVYENNQLIRGATRGNGSVGEEITANMRTLKTIPLTTNFAKFNMAKVEIRGEALIRKDIFKNLNKEREEKNDSVFANPRNAATGALRMKDPIETAERKLEAFIYQLGYAIDQDGNNLIPSLNTHDATIKLLETLGFKTPLTITDPTQSLPATITCPNIHEAIQFCENWQEYRDNYPYELDGMVVKVNDLLLQQQCGYTAHHPRWAIAFKFKARQVTTLLKEVEFQVGKTGAVTPVARLEPAPLAGVTVSNVSLHNAEFIQNKDIRIGDHVLVERAGDVIPYIVKPLTELRTGSEIPIEYPTTCPVCATRLVKPDHEAVWRCENAACEAQVIQRLIFHTSKHAMDIEGLGENTILRFFKLGWIHSIKDLYQLPFDKIKRLEGFGEKSADNLNKAIESAKKNPIHRLLHSLSIHHLGQKSSKLLAAEVNHVLDLQKWTEENFQSIKDIGPVLAKNLYNFFQNNANISLLETIEAYGVNLYQTTEDKKSKRNIDGPLAGKSILFTGTLTNITRDEAEKLATQAGAIIAGSVSKNLHILVVGEKAGSKLKKAQDINTIEIWSETTFLQSIHYPI
jgi:DNA ligase (NAD+)